MAEAQAGHELMRLWDFLDRFEIIAATDEGKGLARAVRPLGDEADAFRRPGVAALGADAPARRHARLENLDSDDAVTRVDAADIFAMRVPTMAVRMVMSVVMAVPARRGLGACLIGAGGPEHP